MRNKISALIAFVIFSVANVSGQTQTIHHQADFGTSSQQSMWGANGVNFSIDQTITLFDQPWNVNWDTGNSGIVNIAGFDFGGAFSGSFSGVVGSEISLEGFTLGQVDVDYPIDVELVMSDDESYDQGDLVTIETSYTVESDYALDTYYPSAGELKWDFYFQMAAQASATICAFGCTSFPIIPTFDTGLQTINLVTVSGNGATTGPGGTSGGPIGVWFLGPGDIPPYTGGNITSGPNAGLDQGVAGWPFALPPTTNTTIGQFIPWQCYLGPGFPADLPDTDFGLSGSITIPYVATDDVLDASTGNIQACGDSTYFNLNLEIFKLLGKILEYSPPPGPAVGLVLSNLSGSQSLGIAELEWNFFSASFDANITNTQCFDFTPKVYGQFNFPVAVEYDILNTNGSVFSSGNSSIINVEIGKDIRYKFPCYYDSLNITPTYTIDGIIRNHTYDVVSFDFLMSAFEFSFEIPAVVVVPGFTIPQVCVSIPYPCPSWSNPGAWCSSTVCTPEIVVPPIGFSGWSLEIGPLWETSIPLGSFSYDWFDETWSLAGFDPISFASFAMVANRLEISTTFTDVICNGDATGVINVTTNAVSPAFPYDFSWSNGTSSTASSTTTSLTNIGAGAYEITVYDNNDCQMFQGATISEPQELVVDYLAQDITCNGANNGTINITAVGGTGVYNYTINGAPTTASITGLTPGTYSIVVSDAVSCNKAFNVVISEPSAIIQSAVISDVSCRGGSNGAIDVSVGGGTLPYSFSWDTAPVQSIEDLTELSVGTYTITVTDGNLCTSIAPYIVAEPLTSIALSVTGTDVLCYGGTSGTVDVITTGGTPGYTYQWFSDLGGVLPYVTEDINTIPTGTYTVVATDANGCTATINQLVSQPIAALSSTPILTNILCFGNATGEIDPGIAGGTTGYSYNWSNGSTAPIATGLIAGSYTLTVTDANGCMDTYSYDLTEPLTALDLVLTGTDILCFGNSTGEVDASVTGGTTDYSYLWSNGATTEDINNLPLGNYSVVVTDMNGCTITDNITLIEPTAPLALSTVVVDVDCFGNNTGSIDLSIVGGSAPYTQLWSNSGSIVLSEVTEDIANQFADTYTVLVTDDHGCTETINALIDEPIAPLAITGIVNDVNCFGINDGAIDITVTGGTLNYTFNWSNAAVTEDLTSIVAGTYQVIVTDNNGCIENASFLVKEPVAPLSITLVNTDVLCNGGNNGAIESTVQGGTLPYSYVWSNGGVDNDIIGIAAGAYSVTVTDGQGCVAFTGTTINEPTAIVVTPTVTDASCYGYDDGEIVITITGGVEPYYFNWGNQNEILLNNASETLDTLVANDYFIRVTDDNGCINEQIVTVGQPAPFVATSIVTDVLCFEGTDGSIDNTIIGGTLPYNTVWNDGQLTEDAINLTEGTFVYTITDGQGCIILDSSYVSQPDLIEISYDQVPVSCIDQTDAAIYINPYGGVAPFNFLWSTGSVDQNVEELAPGQYEVLVSDDHGCSQTFSFEISMNNEECLNIPNTFTPNGDNYNDTWVIGNLDLYPDAMVKVFNKWGNEIFSSNGQYSPWNGTHKGSDLPADVYYYIIVLENNEDNKYTGTITIIR